MVLPHHPVPLGLVPFLLVTDVTPIPVVLDFQSTPSHCTCCAKAREIQGPFEPQHAFRRAIGRVFCIRRDPAVASFQYNASLDSEIAPAKTLYLKRRALTDDARGPESWMQEDLDFFNYVCSTRSYEEGPSVLVGTLGMRRFDKLVPIANVYCDRLDALAALLFFSFFDLTLRVGPRVLRP